MSISLYEMNADRDFQIATSMVDVDHGSAVPLLSKIRAKFVACHVSAMLLRRDVVSR
jgi:hypothetical protein